MSVTWNNAPSASEVNQVHVENRPGNTVNYDNIDITDLIKDKYANPTDHHGFLIRHTDETYYKVAFLASSDHPDESIRPSLKIYYH